MTRPRRYRLDQAPRGKAKWTCLICEDTGRANSERVAMAEFYMHYRLTHYVARKAGA